jgi:hypothetical protein
MNDSEHTPGPWHLLQFGTVEFMDGHKEPAWRVMSCHPHEGLPHQTDVRIAQNLTSEADARLIAAAPDLLAALESLVDAGEDIADMAEDFITARDSKSLRNYGGNIASIARAAIAKAKAKGIAQSV